MNDYLRDQQVLVLGLGASGLAMARWCVRLGAQVTVADRRAAPPPTSNPSYTTRELGGFI